MTKRIAFFTLLFVLMSSTVCLERFGLLNNGDRLYGRAVKASSPDLTYPSDRWQRLWYTITNKNFDSFLGEGPDQANLTFDDNWSDGVVAYGLSDYIGFQSSRTITLGAGTWNFTVFPDDGVRLYIDDQSVIDEWNYQGGFTFSVARSFSFTGSHRFRLDWFEGIGNAFISFSVVPIAILPSTIQSAIDAANPGDSVIIGPATYYENVVIDKTVSLIGFQGNETTIIDGGGNTAIKIMANNVKITGFTIRNGWSGIHMNGFNDTEITQNVIAFNIGTGVGDGIYIMNTHGNVISRNTIVNNTEDGLTLAPNSTDNLVTDNVIVSNGGYAIYMHDLANGNIVKNNNFSMNGAGGIYMFNVQNNSFSGNYIQLNRRGLLMHSSSSNIIKENTIISNWEAAFHIISDQVPGPSINNMIYHNNIINNIVTFQLPSALNKWDAEYPSGGNYWSDYAPIDTYWGVHQNLTGSDMIADTPYVLRPDNIDNYPLITQWHLSRPAMTEFPDINGDGVINILDITIVAKNFGKKFQDP